MAAKKTRKIRNEAQLMYGIQVVWKQGNGRLAAGWAWETIYSASGRVIASPAVFDSNPDNLEILAEKWRKLGYRQIVQVEIVPVRIPAVPVSVPALNAYDEGSIKTLSPMISKTKATA